MSDTNAAATLSLAIKTDEARAALDGLLTKYDELKAGLSAGISTGGFDKEAVAEINNLKAAIASYETKNRDLLNQVQALTDRFKTFSAAAKESAASVSANLSGVTVKARADLKALGETFDDVTKDIIEERKRLAEQGVDFGSSIKGLELVQKSTTENTAALSNYIKKLEVAKQALATLDTPQLLQQRYGSTILTEIGNLDAYKAKLASLRDMAKAASKETEVEDKSSSERKIATHLGEVNKRRVLEKEYSTWWASELKQREAAYAASMLRTAQQRSSMMRVSEERLSRGLVAPSAGTSELAQYYAAMPGVVAGGGGGLAQAEMAASVAAASSVAAAAQKSLGDSHKTTAVAVKDHAAAQQKWNAVTGEGHALARGLSGSLGTLWMTYGQMAPLLAGAALGAGFKAAAQSGAELAYQLTFVKALSEETSASVAVLSKNTLDLAKSSLYGPTEIASGYRILAQAGLDVSSSLQAMPHVLHLATVGEMEMEQAAVTLVGVMNAFNLSVKDAEHVGDVFAKAAALSQTSVVGMTNAMKTASVVGEQYGASMEDTATAITLLAKVNITGTAAGTSFRNMLKELYAPTREAAGVMQRLGIVTKDSSGNLKPFADVIYDLKGKLADFGKGDQVQILQKMFGERGAKEAIAMLALTRKEWDELRKSISDSDGFMGNVSKQLEDEVKGKWVQAMNTMKASLVEAYTTMAPTFGRIAESLKTLFDSESFKSGISSLVTGMVSLADIAVKLAPTLLTLAQAWIAFKVGMVAAAAVSGLTAALGGVTVAVGAAQAAFSGYNTALAAYGVAGVTASRGTSVLSSAVAALPARFALLANPIGLTVAALAAAGAAFYLFRDRSIEAMEQSAQKTAEFAKDSLKNLTELMNKINSTSAAISRAMLNSHEAVRAHNVESLGSMGKSLASRFGLADAAEIEAYVKKVDQAAKREAADWADQNGDFGVSTAANSEQNSAKYKAAKAYYDILQDTRRVQDLLSEATSKALDKEYQETRAKVELEESANQGKKLDASSILNGNDDNGRAARDRMKAETLRERAEKARIAKIEQEQKAEIDLLNSMNSAKLLTEEGYQLRLTAIYDKYDGQIDKGYDQAIARRKAYAENLTGSEKDQVEAGLVELQNLRDKHEAEAALRLQQSKDRQSGIIKSSWESTSKFIAEKAASVQRQIEELDDTKLRLAMSPREEAQYDASKSVSGEFMKQEAAQLEKIRSLRNDLIAQNMAMGADFVDAYTSADMNAQLINYREQLQKLIETRDQLMNKASNVAGDKYDVTRQFSTGWQQAFKEYQESATNSAAAAKSVFAASTSAMSDGLTQFVMTGKVGWKDLASTAIKEAIRAMTNKAVSSFLGVAMNFGLSLLGGSSNYSGWSGSSGASAANMTASPSGAFWNANGNVFSDSSLSRYANTVQTTPQFFTYNKLHGFANGGVFAEAGPEAVMPLARDSNGRLGVRAQGGASNNVSIQIVVNQADGTAQTSAQGANDGMWRQMANRVRGVVVEEITNQKRPGGALYGT